jgi:hypothetical protein
MMKMMRRRKKATMMMKMMNKLYSCWLLVLLENKKWNEEGGIFTVSYQIRLSDDKWENILWGGCYKDLVDTVNF